MEKTLFKYPERIKEKFLATRDLVFTDGHRVTPTEIWRFMTEEAPVRWPYAFDIDPYNTDHVSEDVDFLTGIKIRYFSLTRVDRMNEAKEKGVPLVMTQGGQSMEPYFAAGAIPLRPGFVMFWARDLVDGQDLRAADYRHNTHLENGRRAITIEACNQIAAHQVTEDQIVGIDMVAPYLCLRCSDMAYLTESHRDGKNKGSLPLHMIDYPSNFSGTKQWSIEYVAENLRRMTEDIGRLSGKHVSDDDLREVFKKYNKLRGLTRAISDLVWDAPTPPLSSADFRSVISLGNEPNGDVDAAVCLLEEAKDEIMARVKNGEKGFGVADNAARIFVCGSCVTANPYLVDRAGGYVTGHDDGWAEILTDVEIEGDPYENLAAATLSYPYELPTKDRAKWTADEVTRSHSEGMIFIYNWGCNFQSAPARMIADIVKEEAGVPTVHIGSSDLGKGEVVPQFQNRVEAFIEMLRLKKGFGVRKQFVQAAVS
jgi:benzoyl-CoA reductase/2-hydroxyglutaryl-CoA dehydratase subunit BcrC/BadD/HgdB